MTDAAHAITALTLENFRNYRTLNLQLPAAPVVLMGKNGAGKTNILEAISLLAPGRGMRSAKLREMDRMTSSDASPAVSKTAVLTTHDSRLTTAVPWVVAADIVARHETIRIGTGRDGESAQEKRIIKINGEKVRGHATLASHACVQWLTPAMDQVFVEGGSARRKLVDRLVYGFEPEHATRVTAYALAMRERNRLLADGRQADPYWLSVLEQQMAEAAVSITLARQQMMVRLQASLAEEISHFPRALVSLQGVLESWLEEGISALDAETKFAERLMSLRGVDAARGLASAGPQRSELVVMHQKKQMLAEHCSTGEQKALLLSIMLAAARARADWCAMPPILLLDEVVAHLDVDKRGALFDLIRASRIQAWMTGTDAADFSGLQGFATVLEIDGGMVRN
jgi:DNA replication and repair protein RecF